MRRLGPAGAPPTGPSTTTSTIQLTRRVSNQEAVGSKGQCPPSGVRRWGRDPLAGEEACRRERPGTHPPPRLHAFGRSHPNPTLTTACLLHNAVRAGPIFTDLTSLVFFAGINSRCEPVWRARVPAACACLLPCIPSSRGVLARQEAAMAGRCVYIALISEPGGTAGAHRLDGAGGPDAPGDLQ
jgi:hypothetical protein